MSMTDILVSTDRLAYEIGAPDLRIIDATYFALHPDRDARAEFEAAHLPGALFMDLASLKDPASPVPFMLPSDTCFAERAAALGISDGDRIILYDNTPYQTAGRAWWMFRIFGAQSVAILDGSLAKWRSEGRPIAQGPSPVPARGHFSAAIDRTGVRSLDQMLANVASGTEQVLDARGAARFTGSEPEPRPEVEAGHIPGARNLPYGRLFNDDGSWKRGEALRAAFDDSGIDLAKPMVTTCGSGVTAAILLFGAALLGKSDVALYDGSWSEWGANPSTPKAKGEA